MIKDGLASHSWDSASRGIMTTESCLSMDQMIVWKVPKLFRLIRDLGIMGLDECMNRLGESKAIS